VTDKILRNRELLAQDEFKIENIIMPDARKKEVRDLVEQEAEDNDTASSSTRNGAEQ